MGFIMSSTVSLRLPDNLVRELDKLSKSIERPRTYLIKKALEIYLAEYADYQVALDRLRDKDDEIVSSKDIRNRLGI
jgi:RHH-type rel operon transcriptional repressor/antitoxin RelB